MVVRTRRFILWISLFAAVACGTTYYSVPEVKWRVDVIGLKLSGKIDGIGFVQLVKMIRPGSGYWLQSLAESHNLYSSIFNPFSSPGDLTAGKKRFQQECASCHGQEGVGDSAPSLIRQSFTHGDSDWSIFTNIRSGLDGTAMPKSHLNDRDIWTLVTYIRSMSRPSLSSDSKPELPRPAITSDMLAGSAETPEDWLTYSGSYDSQRYSELDQITNQNASRAKIEWIYQFDGAMTIQETSPIVVADIMYLTEAPNTVHALKASTGEKLWTYTYRNLPDLKICCGAVNRGLAIYGDTLYMGTLDSHLLALDAKTGALKWKKALDDHELGTSITAAPLAVDGKIIVGYGGGDLGIRGFLDAIDASTGSLLWRFYTIPAAGEDGNETWSGDSWKTGGAATWLTGSYDEESRLLFWMTGNPAPDYQGDLRLGDNLYSNSVVALDIDTGEMAWHFQFTPHDEHDWDSNQIPILVDREWRGKQRRLLLLANRNAFFYVLDRDTGEFLLAKSFAHQNWATSIDSDGRPVLNPKTIPTTEGVITWPSQIGATNWQSPSYSPNTGLMYVPALESGRIFFKDMEAAEYNPGANFLGGMQTAIPNESTLYYAIRALDPETGDLVWEYKNPARENWWKTGGLVSTKGNVIFGGDGTDVFLLDAITGQELWRKNVGGRINASPITYEVNGIQYFAIAAGRSLFSIAIPTDYFPGTKPGSLAAITDTLPVSR